MTKDGSFLSFFRKQKSAAARAFFVSFQRQFPDTKFLFFQSIARA